MADKPWVSGPAELLRHGLEHLARESDSDRRIAMISIDNAVELMAKTYLTLPKRVTGIGIPEGQLQRTSFGDVLSRLEELAADRLKGVDLGEIEWYHRRRNQLYHGGDGLTVERRIVITYAELAKVLFLNLFGSELPVPETPGGALLWRFLAAWSRLERVVGAVTMAADVGMDGMEKGRGFVPLPPPMVWHHHDDLDLDGVATEEELSRIHSMREDIISGKVRYDDVLAPEDILAVEASATALQRMLPDGWEEYAVTEESGPWEDA